MRATRTTWEYDRDPDRVAMRVSVAAVTGGNAAGLHRLTGLDAGGDGCTREHVGPGTSTETQSQRAAGRSEG